MDGWLLPAPSAELLESKAFTPLPVMFGFNTDEMLMYVGEPTNERWHQALKALPYADAVAALLAGFPSGNDSTNCNPPPSSPPPASPLMSYWLGFADRGDTNHGGVPPWPRWNVGGEALARSKEIRPETLDTKRCLLLNR